MIRQVADRLFVFIVRTLAPSRIIEGMPVYAVAASSERTAAFERVAAAAALMARHDERRWERIKLDVPGLILWPMKQSTAGALNTTTRYCLVSLHTVAIDRTGIATASVLAHEGMHARLLRCGLPHSRDTLQRIESVCKRAEAHLLQRLPEFTNKSVILARLGAEVRASRSSRAPV